MAQTPWEKFSGRLRRRQPPPEPGKGRRAAGYVSPLLPAEGPPMASSGPAKRTPTRDPASRTPRGPPKAPSGHSQAAPLRAAPRLPRTPRGPPSRPGGSSACACRCIHIPPACRPRPSPTVRLPVPLLSPDTPVRPALRHRPRCDPQPAQPAGRGRSPARRRRPAPLRTHLCRPERGCAGRSRCAGGGGGRALPPRAAASPPAAPELPLRARPSRLRRRACAAGSSPCRPPGAARGGRPWGGASRRATRGAAALSRPPCCPALWPVVGRGFLPSWLRGQRPRRTGAIPLPSAGWSLPPPPLGVSIVGRGAKRHDNGRKGGHGRGYLTAARPKLTPLGVSRPKVCIRLSV